MKIYILLRSDRAPAENIFVTSSKILAEHLCETLNKVDSSSSYTLEEHELIGISMMEYD